MATDYQALFIRLHLAKGGGARCGAGSGGHWEEQSCAHLLGRVPEHAFLLSLGCPLYEAKQAIQFTQTTAEHTELIYTPPPQPTAPPVGTNTLSSSNPNKQHLSSLGV